MMTSDMNLALESVEVLKGAMHNAVKVPQNTQAQVQGCLNMPATYNTVVARTQLAHQFYEHVSEVARMCCQLVHDQHLQQQGWAAVVASLEDIVAAFRARHDAFQQNFVEYLSGREKVALLQFFEEDLKLLARIPVFPEFFLGKTQEEEEEEEAGKKRTSTAQKKRRKSRRMRRGQEEEEEEKEKINKGLLKLVGQEVSAVLREADRPQMKGLGEHLCGLEQLMHDAAYMVQEQSNFSQKANFCPRAMPPEAPRPAFLKSLPRHHLPCHLKMHNVALQHTTPQAGDSRAPLDREWCVCWQ
ncbi:uncharacterized protein LOC135100412 isoform X4 [Scylla paramamosain]